MCVSEGTCAGERGGRGVVGKKIRGGENPQERSDGKWSNSERESE